MKLTRFDSLQPIRLEKTTEGFLKGEARVTRAGIFNYQRGDGTIERELRHPNEVLDSRSLETLKLVPIVDDNSGFHPAMITAENSKKFSVGTVGEQIRIEDGWVIASVVIRDADSVKRAERGDRVELSCGYIADVDEREGTFDGERYDSRQQNIRYNHLAIVDSARAGPEARLRLDSTAAVLTQEKPQMERRDSNDTKTVAVKLDGIDYQAAPEVANALVKAHKEIADGKTAVEKAAAEVTAAKAETEKQKGRADAAEDTLKKEREALPAKVKARAQLVTDARRILGDEMKDEGTDVEIMKAALKKVSPELKTDDTSVDYIRARFDAAVESLGEDAMAEQRRLTGDDKRNNQPKGDAKSARDRMIARQRGEPETTKGKE